MFSQHFRPFQGDYATAKINYDPGYNKESTRIVGINGRQINNYINYIRLSSPVYSIEHNDIAKITLTEHY